LTYSRDGTCTECQPDISIDGVYLNQTSEMYQMSQTCSSWEIRDISTNTSSDISYAKTDQCPYDVVSISTNFFCAQTLYLGFYKFEYMPNENVYIGKMSTNTSNVYYLKWTDPGWAIFDQNNETYAQSEAHLGCPHDLRWHRVCGCWQNVTCECGDIQTFPMNAPTIRQQDSTACAQTVYYIAQPTMNIKMDRLA
jgi:hypothetical protein